MKLPDVDFHQRKPLIATARSMVFEKIRTIETNRLQLKDIPGFSGGFPVYFSLQEKPAPLAVLILDAGEKSDSGRCSIARQQLFNSGFSVLSFDSPFSSSFAKSSGTNVPGNLTAEAKKVVSIIDSFRKNDRVSDKISRIGLVGLGYGATVALHVDALKRSGELKFDLSGILALSPPIDFRETVSIIDRLHLGKAHSSIEIASAIGDLSKSSPRIEDSVARDVIGSLWHSSLLSATSENKNTTLRFLGPAPSMEERMEFDSKYTFGMHLSEVAVPFWVHTGNWKTSDDVWNQAKLKTLTSDLSPYVKIVIAKDDPLVFPDSGLEFQKSNPDNTIFIGKGGHLGYLDTNWFGALSKSLFKEAHP